MLRSKFLIICKCPGPGTLLTTKCPGPGTLLTTKCPGPGTLLTTKCPGPGTLLTTKCPGPGTLLTTKCPGPGTLLTTKCPGPGTHRASNALGLPGGGMFAARIDSHINYYLIIICRYLYPHCVLAAQSPNCYLKMLSSGGFRGGAQGARAPPFCGIFAKDL